MFEKVGLATHRVEISNMFTTPEFSSRFEMCKIIQNKDEVLPWLEQYYESGNSLDIFVISEGIPSSTGLTTQALILKIHERFPRLRIVFLAGNIEDDDYIRLQVLAYLVEVGIYDIYRQSVLTRPNLLNLLTNPQTFDDAKYYLDYLDSQKFPSELKNTVVISSIKPGTGKTFLAVNTAVAIAKFGRMKSNGYKPRVAIIEGDLANLSVGTLLQIDDPHKNLRVALELIKTVVDEDGIITGTQEKIEEVKQGVRSCFVKHSDVSNLFALCCSQLTLDDLSEINSYHYYFLIQLVVEAFDIVIVDTNSSLEHRSTAPLLELASICYFILDLDSNNIRNNMRYKKELEMLQISQKVRYILNRDLPKEKRQVGKEELLYGAKDLEEVGFKLLAKIPWIDSSIMYNRIRRGTPIILEVNEVLNDAKVEIFTVANDIWPLEVPAEEFKVNNDKSKKQKKTKTKDKSKPWWKFW